MDNEVSLRIREAKEEWHQFARDMERLRREANKRPLEAAQTLLLRVVDKRLIARRNLRSDYGIDVYESEPFFRIVYPEFVPEELDQLLTLLYDESSATAQRLKDRRVPLDSPLWGCLTAVVHVMCCDDLLRNMERVKDGNNPAQAIVDEFIETATGWRAGLPGMIATGVGVPPEMRLSGLVTLTGWVASLTSLSKNQRLKRTLSSDPGSSPFEKLLQELPTTTYIEWDAGQELRELFSLPRRVARSLEKLGREAEIKSKVVDQEDYPEAAYILEDDMELQHFEAKEEAARQKLSMLVKKAKLPHKEQRALEFELQGLEVKDIAREMGVSENTIKTFRKRYRDKLKAATG